MKRIYLYLGAGRDGRHVFSKGTFDDLKAAEIEPLAGLRLEFYSDDANDLGAQDNLLFEGVVGYDKDEATWYAVIDWDSLRHESQTKLKTP